MWLFLCYSFGCNIVGAHLNKHAEGGIFTLHFFYDDDQLKNYILVFSTFLMPP